MEISLENITKNVQIFKISFIILVAIWLVLIVIKCWFYSGFIFRRPYFAERYGGTKSKKYYLHVNRISFLLIPWKKTLKLSPSLLHPDFLSHFKLILQMKTPGQFNIVNKSAFINNTRFRKELLNGDFVKIQDNCSTIFQERDSRYYRETDFCIVVYNSDYYHDRYWMDLYKRIYCLNNIYRY